MPQMPTDPIIIIIGCGPNPEDCTPPDKGACPAACWCPGGGAPSCSTQQLHQQRKVQLTSSTKAPSKSPVKVVSTFDFIGTIALALAIWLR